MFSQGVFVLAVASTLLYLVYTRRHMRQGGIVIPPIAAGMIVFALGIIVVVVTGLSSLHLLWWLPCSFIVGLAILLSPLGQRLVLTCLMLLAMPLQQSEEAQLQPVKNTRARRRKRQTRRSKRRRSS